MWKLKGKAWGQAQDWYESSATQLHSNGLEWWAFPSRGVVITVTCFFFQVFTNFLCFASNLKLCHLCGGVTSFALLSSRLLVLKWEIRDLLWSFYNNLGNLSILFSLTQGWISCQNHVWLLLFIENGQMNQILYLVIMARYWLPFY